MTALWVNKMSGTAGSSLVLIQRHVLSQGCSWCLGLGVHTGFSPHLILTQACLCFPPSPQHHLLHPGRLAGPVLRGLPQAPGLCLPQAAHLLRAPQHPRLGPGAPSPHPAGPVPAARAERVGGGRWGPFPACGGSFGAAGGGCATHWHRGSPKPWVLPRGRPP